MPYNAIEKTLSIPRFRTYRSAIVSVLGEECEVAALELYQWNANLAARFFYPLHIYEVVLRNAISEAFTRRYGENWPTNEVFQNSLNYQDKQTLLRAMENGYEGGGKLLPEIKFVWFENALTKRHHGRIWSRYIETVFPNTPDTLTPVEIRTRLKNACYVVRKFRNRCGHHEPVFNNDSLSDILPLMTETVAWRCDHTYKWLKDQETVSELLSNPVI
jgi:hypothetical protein